MKFGWVDFSREDREKVLSVIDLLHEPGTLDELGIGPIRDGFANYFFPGTSTIQTRAKYFLIVPYILKEAVSGKYGSKYSAVMRKIDDEEKKCGIRLLERNPDALGIIGGRVLPHGWVKRTPATIYWNGILTYGIYSNNRLSMSQAVQLGLRRYEEENANRKLRVHTDDAMDDDDAGQMTKYPTFHVPADYNGSWFESLSIDLTPSEADFLAEHIEKNIPTSLFSYMLRNSIDLSLYPGFVGLYEGMNQREGFPQYLLHMMKLACDFDALVYMTRVVYNLILSEGNNIKAKHAWHEYLEHRTGIEFVNVSDVMTSLKVINPMLEKFLIEFQNAIRSGDLDTAKEIVRQREIRLKTVARAKTVKAGQFKEQDWYGGEHLDYRMSNAATLLRDIYAGRLGYD